MMFLQKLLGKRLFSRLTQQGLSGLIGVDLSRLGYAQRMKLWHLRVGIAERLIARKLNPLICVDIETTTECNRRCSYCPNSEFDRGLHRNARLMDKALFEKIIAGLKRMGFRGILQPNFYGEPFIDPRLPDLLEHAAHELPDARIEIYTNGDFITQEYLERLASLGVWRIVITQHSVEPSPFTKLIGNPALTEHKVAKHLLREFRFIRSFSFTASNSRVMEIRFQAFNESSYLDNRGGLVKIQQKKKEQWPPCAMPYSPMMFQWDGKVVLCCNDYNATHVLGDATVQEVEEIWNSKQYREARKWMKTREYHLPICKACTGK